MLNKPLGFIDPTHPDFIFKLKKTLYDLKRAPSAWYERLSSFVLKIVLLREVDTTLFTKHVDNDTLIV